MWRIEANFANLWRNCHWSRKLNFKSWWWIQETFNRDVKTKRGNTPRSWQCYRTNRKEIGEIKVKHHSLLQKYLDEIKQLQSLMQQILLALNEIEESNEVSQTIHYNSRNEEFSKLPPKVHVSIPKFLPKVWLESPSHYLSNCRRESSLQGNKTLYSENCRMNANFLTQSRLDMQTYAVLPLLMKNKYGRVDRLRTSNVFTFKVFSRIHSKQSVGSILLI